MRPNLFNDAETGEDGRIILVEMVPAEVPIVKPRRIKGRLRGAEVTLLVKPWQRQCGRTGIRDETLLGHFGFGHTMSQDQSVRIPLDIDHDRQ